MRTGSDTVVDPTGPVTLILGTHDVLVEARAAERIWRCYFPHATTQLVNDGHVVHLEAPPSVWLPDS